MKSAHPRTSGRRPARVIHTVVAGLALAMLPTVGLVSGPAASAPTTPLSGSVVAAAPVAGAATAARQEGSYWKQVASEPFDRLDTSRWGVFNGRAGCCPDTEWSSSMVEVSNGVLKLHTAPRNGKWLSGGVGAWGWKAATRTYGRWDARIKFDKGQGVSAAALLWPSGDTWPPELDFYEIFDGWADRSKMQVTTHWRSGGQHLRSQKAVQGDFSQWHVASVRWGPGRVAYALDGKIVKVDTSKERIPRAQMWLGFQTHAHKVNGQYPRLPEGRSSVALSVDWVKVFTRR